MRSWLVVSVLCFPLTVFTSNVVDNTYDEYYDEEETESPNQPTWKPSKGASKVEAYVDIFKFYNTTEKIWVYNSTRKSEETCQVDDIEHTSYINVFFTRYYFLRGKIEKLTMNPDFGVHPTIQNTTHTYNEIRIRIPAQEFFAGRKKAALVSRIATLFANAYIVQFIITCSGVMYRFETLVFLSEKKDCGVFYINYHGNDLPGPHDWFELRLWNSSLENGPDKNCSHGFEEITAPLPKTFNYTSVCQCILRVQA
uniref:Putative group i salivary lipocalin n=1 Tax=Rhipicephalus pulchellus TaxID=72859 RepID=L7LRG9_RHIPC